MPNTPPNLGDNNGDLILRPQPQVTRSAEVAEAVDYMDGIAEGEIDGLFADEMWVKVKAYIAQLEAQGSSRWQPIETAPKDGTPLLGFMPTYYKGKGGFSVIIWMKGSRSPNGDWYDNRAWITQPTHWMPLPTPPTQQQEETM